MYCSSKNSENVGMAFLAFYSALGSTSNCRIIYEKGVEICRQPDGHWYYPSSTGENIPVCEISPAGVWAAFGLRPVVLAAVAGSIKGTTLLLPSEESIDETLMSDGPAFFTLPPDHWFDTQLGGLFHKMVEAKIKITTAEKVTYILKAVSYHCQRLAETYSLIRRDFTAIPWPPRDRKADSVLFSANYSPWFEFDALVTAVRRAYDSTSSILWSTFGDNVNCPASFYKTYPECHQLPSGLRTRLETSWEKYGKKITFYRNNVQHYATMDFGMGSVKMMPLNDRLWGMKVLLPDNPEVRSRDKLLYKEGVDALAYGWEIACEVLDVTSSIVVAVDSQHASEPKNGGLS
jgi:hypothetical protein